MKKNVTLIGMPGSGKSTVGVVLAKVLGYHFVDSDLVIQEQTGKLLHELITEYGDEGFLEIENKVNAGLQVEKSVIATGGSAVFGEEAMEHLREISTVVYLKLSYPNLKKLLEYRTPYYEKYAHVVVDEEDMDIRGVVETITSLLEEV